MMRQPVVDAFSAAPAVTAIFGLVPLLLAVVLVAI
jgi:hypothetical protein